MCLRQAVDSGVEHLTEKLCLALFEADLTAFVRPRSRPVDQPVNHGGDCALPKAELSLGSGFEGRWDLPSRLYDTLLYLGEREGAPMFTITSAQKLEPAAPSAPSGDPGRAIALIAAPRRREPLKLMDRTATFRFLVRDLAQLEVEMMQTELGGCLVTTPEQTVLDLAYPRTFGAMEKETLAAIGALLPRCDWDVMAVIAVNQRRGKAFERVRGMTG